MIFLGAGAQPYEMHFVNCVAYGHFVGNDYHPWHEQTLGDPIPCEGRYRHSTGAAWAAPYALASAFHLVTQKRKDFFDLPVTFAFDLQLPSNSQIISGK